MESRRRVAGVWVGVFAVVVLLVVLTPAEGTAFDGNVETKPVVTILAGDFAEAALAASSTSCTCPCGPDTPSPAAGATGVAIDTRLSWKVPAPKGCDRFRLLASTGGIGGDVNPFSLVELATDPVREVSLGPAYSLGFVPSMDSSPDGFLYGSYDELCIVDPSTGSTRTVCGSLYTAKGRPVLLNGMAFHPDGTLYGIEWDSDTDDNVFYTIDLARCTATEVCRISIYVGDAWGIDFSPEGVLYGAFAELVRFDLAKGTATIVGRRFSLPFINDIDYAPDGFIYGVDNMEWRLYKINPSTGLIVAEYGPYDSELWGVASECLAPVCPGGTAGALVQALNAASTPGSPAPREPAGRLRAVGDELQALTKRGRRLDRLALRDAGTGAEDTTGRSAAEDETSSPLFAAAADGSSDIVCAVYLDTVNPPVKGVGRSVLPPAAGDVWICNPGVLRPDLTYYWRVVARNSCGVMATGPVWSFKTQGPIFQDTFSSTTIDPAQWPVVKGAIIDDTGRSETSPSCSLRLGADPNGGDSVESAAINLSGYAKVTLSYCFKQAGDGNDPDGTNDLVFEYYNGDGWVELGRQLDADPATTSFQCVAIALPAEALAAQFKLRVRCVGTTSDRDGPSGNKEWFVDDVTLCAN